MTTRRCPRRDQSTSCHLVRAIHIATRFPRQGKIGSVRLQMNRGVRSSSYRIHRLRDCRGSRSGTTNDRRPTNGRFLRRNNEYRRRGNAAHLTFRPFRNGQNTGTSPGSGSPGGRSKLGLPSEIRTRDSHFRVIVLVMSVPSGSCNRRSMSRRQTRCVNLPVLRRLFTTCIRGTVRAGGNVTCRCSFILI